MLLWDGVTHVLHFLKCLATCNLHCRLYWNGSTHKFCTFATFMYIHYIHCTTLHFHIPTCNLRYTPLHFYITTCNLHCTTLHWNGFPLSLSVICNVHYSTHVHYITVLNITLKWFLSLPPSVAKFTTRRCSPITHLSRPQMLLNSRGGGSGCSC